MDINRTHFGGELVISIIALVLFGTLYNLAIQKWPWLAHRRPAEQVVGGVLVTVIVSGFVIGWDAALAVLVLFSASGGPMLIGSWTRAARDDEEAKQIAREHLK